MRISKCMKLDTETIVTRGKALRAYEESRRIEKR